LSDSQSNKTERPLAENDYSPFRPTADTRPAAGLPALSLHGLRRSFGTLAEWVECPVGVSAQIMGHKPSAIAEKHYRRRPLDLLRMWHCRIETWILQEAGVSVTGADDTNLPQLVKSY